MLNIFILRKGIAVQLSEKIKSVRVSGTVKLSQMARDLKSAGRDIIELSEGEPDFDTPRYVIDAAHQAAVSGQTRYTAVAGTLPLRRAICEKFSRDNAITFQPGEIIVGTGAKQLIFNALLATMNPGDEAIIPAPYWVSYPDMVKIADGVPVIVECGPEQGFKISAKALENAITERTRWLILNSPGNPSGSVYSTSELAGLAEVLRRHPEVSVISDDIYEAIIFDGHEFATMASVAPDLTDRILTVNGVSKSYAMTGWRIGYAGGPADLIGAMTKLQGQSTTNPSSVGQAAALAALDGPQDFLTVWLNAYSHRRELVRSRLEGVHGLTLQLPQGAFYHFVGCSGLYGRRTPAGDSLTSDTDFSGYLINHAGVALVPGSEFGCPGYVRLCFAKSEHELAEACKRIRDAVSDLQYGDH